MITINNLYSKIEMSKKDFLKFSVYFLNKNLTKTEYLKNIVLWHFFI